MRPYEMIYKLLFSYALPHYQLVRSLLAAQTCVTKTNPKTLLDIGGRKSPYTIGLDLDVTIIDLPQESEIQKNLRLGLNEEYILKIQRKRSNIRKIIINDFLKYEFPAGAFDLITAVEVIEHIYDDDAFIKKCSTVLNINGMGIFTTPNGDYLKVNRKINPDHLRHYTKAQFEEKLACYFHDVNVFYFARFTKDLLAGIRPWNIKKPVQTFRSMLGNSNVYRQALNYSAPDCAYLIAVVKKPIN